MCQGRWRNDSWEGSYWDEWELKPVRPPPAAIRVHVPAHFRAVRQALNSRMPLSTGKGPGALARCRTSMVVRQRRRRRRRRQPPAPAVMTISSIFTPPQIIRTPLSAGSQGSAPAAITPVQQRHYPHRSGHLMVFKSSSASIHRQYSLIWNWWIIFYFSF